MLSLHQKYGKLPIEKVLEPAVELAKNGFKVNDGLKGILISFINVYNNNNGQMLEIGDIFKNVELSHFIKKIGQQKDPIILQEYYNNIGLDYEPCASQIYQPILVNFRNFEVRLPPPPSEGGLEVAVLLQVIEELGTSRNDTYQERLIKIFKSQIAMWNAKKFIIDQTQPKTNELIERLLVNKEYKKHNQIKIGPIEEKTQTWQISIIDKDLNAVSLTSSNGTGCGIVDTKTGILGNNFLGEKDLNPLGFMKAPPGSTLTSQVTPVLIYEFGKLKYILGSPGSNRIMTAIAQVIDLLSQGYSCEEAVYMNRIHFDGTILQLERPSTFQIDEAEISQLVKNEVGVEIQFQEPQGFYFGGVMIVSVEFEKGSADPRRDGCFMTCQ